MSARCIFESWNGILVSDTIVYQTGRTGTQYPAVSTFSSPYYLQINSGIYKNSHPKNFGSFMSGIKRAGPSK
jgi:hypothetical protein